MQYSMMIALCLFGIFSKSDQPLVSTAASSHQDVMVGADLSLNERLTINESLTINERLTLNNDGISYKSIKNIVSYETGNYIRSALFAEEIHHFDDLYLIHIIDGDVPIVIFCNRNYCYRPEDAERYS